MNRIDFIKSLSIAALSLPIMNLKSLANISISLTSTPRMPMLFVGHGNPMNAIVQNDFHKKWISLGQELPQPKAILVVSAHWMTRHKTKVTAMSTPKTIHDFGGFPQELFDQQYPAPGSPEMARLTIEQIHSTVVHEDMEWGLDHGTWSVLKPMFPKADIPVFQLSLDMAQSMDFHFSLGKELQTLRDKGVLIIGSGNMVHNLRKLSFDQQTYDWAQSFDSKMKSFIDQRDFKSVVNFQKLGQEASLAHPSYEHFLPLFYVLGASNPNENIEYFNDSFDMASISMRSLLVHS